MTLLRRCIRASLAGLETRGGGLAALVYAALVGLTALAGGLIERSQRKSDHGTIERARQLKPLLAKMFADDTAERMSTLALPVLAATLALIALTPLWAAGLALASTPKREGTWEANPFVRLIGTTLAMLALGLVTLSLAFGAIAWAAPGILGWYDLRSTLWALIAASVAALPSAAIAVAARSLSPRSRLVSMLAFSAILALRYTGPRLVRLWAPLHWVVPRSYELPLLSSSNAQIANAAVLAIAWSLVVTALGQALLRGAAGSASSNRRLSDHAQPGEALSHGK